MSPRPRFSLSRSVRGRLILLVGAIAAPAILIATVLVFQAYRNQRDSVTQHLTATARALAFLVDRNLAEYEALLKGLSTSRALEERDFATFYQRARSIAEGQLRWVVLSDLEGRQFVNTRVPFGTPLPQSEGESDFKPVLASGRTYVSNLVTGAIAKTLVIFVSVPVRVAGQPLLALTLVVTPASFASSLHIDQIAPASVVTIVDREGTVVARSRSPELFVGRKATADMVAAATSRESGFGSSVTLEGIPVVTAFNRATLSGWSGLIGAPKSDLYASARQLLWLGLGLSTVLLLTAGAMAVWIVRGLTRGVDSLVAETAAWGEGAGGSVVRSGLIEMDFVADAMAKMAHQLRQTAARLEEALAQEQIARSEAEALSEAAQALTGELDLQGVVQKATDVATKLTGAAFGAFFYNVVDHRQESSLLCTLSGVPREAFEKFGPPRNPAGFIQRFNGKGVVRVGDVTTDPRYVHDAPFHGMPAGLLPVRSYLAVPVVSHTGDVLGGMFFGHPHAEVFSERCERIAVGIAAQASIAVDNAKLYRSARAAVERLNFSLSSLHLGEWDWDAATDAMQISLRAAEIFGFPIDQKFTREQMRSAVHPEDRDRARAVAQEAALVGSDYRIEYRVTHPDLGLRWVAATGRPVFGADGKLTAMMGVVQDITDRKNAEMMLRTQNEVLEQRVAERTKKLRETIGELEAFSYSVSHDMRAPLRSMQGYAELLLKDYATALDATGQHYLARISANSQRLELLVRDVLIYSRVAQEEVELNGIELDTFLPALLQQMPETQVPGVAIAIRGPLPRVMAHEAYLSQIFTNLIGNAVKFVGPGVQPKVAIAAAVTERNTTITVSDNGIGIDPEHFERIFQIFGRVHADKAFEGTGIGLAIVKKAVQRMGGEIGIHSTLGGGTTFWFSMTNG